MGVLYVLQELLALSITTLLVLYRVGESFILGLIPSAWRTKKSIAGQIALITGAGHGLGREIALRLARHGATVVLLDINSTANEETKDLITADGGIAQAYTCDVSDWQHVNDVAQQVAQDVGQVTILINNAGIIGSCDRIINTPPDFIENTFRVNILSQFWVNCMLPSKLETLRCTFLKKRTQTVKAFLPYMLEVNNGHIVNIGSVLGYTGQDKLAAYCSTKHAVHGFHESLTWEIYAMGKHGVKTTLVAPGAFTSGMFAGVKVKFEFLTPFMSTASVADRTIDAILLNEDIVVVPRTPLLFAIIKTIMPWKATMHGYEFFGATSNTADLPSKVPAAVSVEPIAMDL